MKLLTAGSTVHSSNNLGGGCYGVCFAIDDATVVKFTTSQSEYEAALKLVGARLDNVWHIYGVGICDTDTRRKIEGFANRFYNCRQVFWIVGERVKPLSQERLGKAKNIGTMIDYSWGWTVWNRMQSKMQRRVDAELIRFGLTHRDLHSNNVGFRGARMVAFDVQ